MRYAKKGRLLKLALRMQGSPGGISLRDIEEEFGVGRRTAERMRDAVLDLFPEKEVETDERTKRWRILPGTLNPLIRFSADELADLEAAISLMRREGLAGQAEGLSVLMAKLHALQKPEVAPSVETDLDALLEAEGLAMRPGPRQTIRPEVLAGLREAIKGCLKVKLLYRKREDGSRVRRTVCPYGILYGSRHRLVAYREREKTFRPYVLMNIEKVEPTGEAFERQPDFSLQAYAERSFGTYQDDPVDVVWKFSPEVAEDARSFLFHPTQKLEEQRDGSLLVRFRAGGLLEMAWHLFTWGEGVEVVEPKKLKTLLTDLKRC